MRLWVCNSFRLLSGSASSSLNVVLCLELNVGASDMWVKV